MNLRYQILISVGCVFLILVSLTFATYYLFQVPAFFNSIPLEKYDSFIEWGILSSLCLAGIFYFIFIRRIEKLNKILGKIIDEKEFTQVINVKGSDDISLLIQHINTLTDEILSTDEQLEHKVRARTKKLQERIDALETRLNNLSDEKQTLIFDNEGLIKKINFDLLTHLPSRIHFNEKLNESLASAKANNKLLGILLINLDNFKDINDVYGRNLGDIVLTEIVNRIKKMLRDHDTLSRSGGAEFSILLEDIVHLEYPSLIADKILECCKTPLNINGNIIQLKVKIGIAIYPDDGSSLEELLINADTAMFKTKNNAEVDYERYNKEMNVSLTEQNKLSTILETAISNNEFVIYYQPIFDLKNGKVIGIEALLRWGSPMLGLIAPSRFLPIAEKTGHILSLDEWVLKEACRVNQAWHVQGFPTLPIAVNLSPIQFYSPDIANHITTILKKSGLKPSLLDIEINSSVLADTQKNVDKILQSIIDTGVNIIFDEFGFYPILINRIKEFPIKSLKIDKRLVKDVTLQNANKDIIKAIINLASDFNINVSAAGIETIEQLEFLTSHHCTTGQGYFFSKPLPELEFLSSGYLIDNAK